MTSLDCPFCRKLSNLDEVPADEMVWQFPHSVALLGTSQYYLGYCLLVARRHATELSQLSDAERMRPRIRIASIERLKRQIERLFLEKRLPLNLRDRSSCGPLKTK